MAFVGMKYVVAAMITDETPGRAITYGQGVVVGKAISADLTWERANSELAADDMIAEYDNTIVSGTLSIGVDDIDEDAKTALGIHKEVEGEAGVYRTVGNALGYMGVGYIRVRKKSGVTSYKAQWIFKAALGIESESARTKGQSIEWQTPVLSGKMMPVIIDNGNENVLEEHKMCANEAEAVAWLNAKANIQSAA